VILKFSTPAARNAFFARVKVDAPALYLCMKPSYSQPTVAMVREISGPGEARIRKQLAGFLGSDVTVFDDVQFKAMPRSAVNG
jgi:hypothetical protein